VSDHASRTGWRAYWRDYALVLDGRHSLPGLVFVLGLMLFAGLLDLIGVGLVAPFVALVVGQDIGALPRVMSGAAQRMDLTTLGIVIVGVFVMKSVIAYRLQRRIVRFSEAHRAQLMTRLLERYLARSYESHLTTPTTERVNTLFWHTAHYAGATLAGSLRLLTDAIVLGAVIAMLCTISLAATMLLAAFLGVVTVFTAGWVRRELASTSQIVATAQTAALRAVQNSLGAFREIRVLGTADAFRAALDAAAKQLADATARQHALHYVPRVSVETALVTFLVVLSLLAVRGAGGAAGLVPVLGAMGVAAMRLMPLATSLLSSLNGLRSSRVALGAVAAELRGGDGAPDAVETLPVGTPTPFSDLSLRNVSFRYPNAAAPSLHDVDLDVRRGEVLGIAGRSGAGKSTLVDVLLGLLTPQSGEVRRDGALVTLDSADWHRQCAYIPQDVFLIDGSLRDNITFGHASPQAGQIEHALRQARLDTLVASLPRGLDAPVGERGVSLSGGQRQRVAIARALFHDRSVLVMDEATSALDSETEADVVAAIRALRGERTVIVVAHRESMLAACDRVVRLEAGRVVPVPCGGAPDKTP
jgi:ATP-binding cassette, subfamily B, bacterial PglK